VNTDEYILMWILCKFVYFSWRCAKKRLAQ